MATNTPTKLRSGKIINPSMDELSGLFSKSMKFATPKSKRTQPTEDDMFANMFSKITIGKKIGKSRKRGTRFTHKKSHKTPKSAGMDMTGGRRRKRRHTKQSRSKRSRTTSVH
jgi:hypothetical protein